MKNIWSAIFNRAIIDNKTGSLSLIDCLEELTVNFSEPEELSKAKKNIPIRFTIIGLWIDTNIETKREFDYLVQIIDPQNNKINEFSNRPAFEAGKKRLRTLVEVNGLGLTTEGEYKIVIKYKESGDEYIIASEMPLSVKFLLNTSVNKK